MFRASFYFFSLTIWFCMSKMRWYTQTCGKLCLCLAYVSFSYLILMWCFKIENRARRKRVGLNLWGVSSSVGKAVRQVGGEPGLPPLMMNRCRNGSQGKCSGTAKRRYGAGFCTAQVPPGLWDPYTAAGGCILTRISRSGHWNGLLLDSWGLRG